MEPCSEYSIISSNFLCRWDDHWTWTMNNMTTIWRPSLKKKLGIGRENKLCSKISSNPSFTWSLVTCWKLYLFTFKLVLNIMEIQDVYLNFTCLWDLYWLSFISLIFCPTNNPYIYYLFLPGITRWMTKLITVLLSLTISCTFPRNIFCYPFFTDQYIDWH